MTSDLRNDLERAPRAVQNVSLTTRSFPTNYLLPLPGQRLKVRCEPSISDSSRCVTCLSHNIVCHVQSEELGQDPTHGSEGLSGHAWPVPQPLDRLTALERQVVHLQRTVESLSNDRADVRESPRSIRHREGRQTRDLPGSLSPPVQPLIQSAATPVRNGNLTLTPASAKRDKLYLQLQDLTPSSYSTSGISSQVPDWWSAVHGVAPPLSIKTASSLLSIHRRFTSDDNPRMTTLDLAVWLLNMAISVHYLALVPVETRFKYWEVLMSFPETCSDAIERLILRDDELSSTVKGLECHLLWIRLNMNLARPKKAWLGLRRAISIGELVGLSHSIDRIGHHQSRDDDLLRASIWTGLAVIDKFSIMLFNLTPITAGLVVNLPERLSKSDDPCSVQWSLSELAAELAERDRLWKEDRPSEEIIRGEIDLMSQWLDSCASFLKSSTDARIIPMTMARYTYHFLQLCNYMPATFDPVALPHSVSSEAHRYRSLCWGAGRRLAEQYIALGQSLGSFDIIRMIDLPAFAAAVVLLLYGVCTVSQRLLENQALPQICKITTRR